MANQPNIYSDCSFFMKKHLLNFLLSLFIIVVCLLSSLFFLENHFEKQALEQQIDYLSHRRYIRLRENPPNADYTTHPQKLGAAFDSTLLPQTDYHTQTDANGFIEPSKVHENPDLNIVFLGGSTTACAYVEAQKRFAYLTGKMLEDSLGIKINSYNSGVDGNNSLHSINLLINKILPLQPDIAVLYHNINDLVTLQFHQTYWNDSPTRSVIEQPSEHYLKYVMPSADGHWLYHWFPYFYGKMVPQDGLSPSQDEFMASRGREIIGEDLFKKIFSRNLKTFVHICRANSITPVLMTQTANFPPDFKASLALRNMEMPDSLMQFYDTHYPKMVEAFGVFNESIRAVCEQEGVVLVDLAANMQAIDEHLYDEVHFNTKGSEQAARLIVEAFLKEKKLILF